MKRIVLMLAGVLVLAVGASHAQSANLCTAGKLKCVNKKAKKLLKCHEKAAKAGVDPNVDPKTLECLQKAMTKFDGGSEPTKGCFAKLEAKYGATCVTSGDTAALEAKVDAFVIDVVDALDGP